MNYNSKRFRPISNSENGEVSNDMIFCYEQIDNILSCTYTGSKIKRGHLIGLVSENGTIHMRYHQVNQNNELMTGTCISTPELLKNGKIRLHETWQWTSGDQTKGSSILEEI